MRVRAEFERVAHIHRCAQFLLVSTRCNPDRIVVVVSAIEAPVGMFRRRQYILPQAGKEPPAAPNYEHAALRSRKRELEPRKTRLLTIAGVEGKHKSRDIQQVKRQQQLSDEAAGGPFRNAPEPHDQGKRHVVRTHRGPYALPYLPYRP